MKRKLLLVVMVLVIAMIAASCSSVNFSQSPGSNMYDNYEEEYYENYYDNETYSQIDQNKTTLTGEQSTVTFSLKVDTASYTNVARIINNGTLPVADAVRTEEMINYFSYDGDTIKTDSPFSYYAEIGKSAFDESKHMAFIRIKTDEIEKDKLPPSNLTFLIDTSGSMYSYDKLPLLQKAFKMLVENLNERDTVSIVTYAGSSKVVLDSVSGDQKSRIINAIDDLEAGGSTGGEEGIRTAYSLAHKNYREGGNNRVILATDGDFNVGISSTDKLKDFISEQSDGGVYLSILGFGTGNLRDDMMETLSQHGNGNYSYIDSTQTAKKVLINEMGSNMFTVADDVKAQVQFNADTVKSYRLIGYENRKMSNEDFNNDNKDAGEIGAGSDVVVMFELELQDRINQNDQLFILNIAYKDPGEYESKYLKQSITGDSIAETNSSDFNFACSVAAFGDALRDQGLKRGLAIEKIADLAVKNLGVDAEGYRLDHVILLSAYRKLISSERE